MISRDPRSKLKGDSKTNNLSMVLESNRSLRKPLLYPAELRDHVFNFNILGGAPLALGINGAAKAASGGQGIAGAETSLPSCTPRKLNKLLSGHVRGNGSQILTRHARALTP